MSDTKAWFHSKTIWGALIAGAAAVASVFGIDVDENTQNLLAQSVLQIVTVVGSLLAIFGRLQATQAID